MNIREETKTIYLAIGNDTRIKSDLFDIENLSEPYEISIIYSDKIPPVNKKFIDRIAKNHKYVTLECVTKSKQNKLSSRLLQRIKEIHSFRPDISIVVMSTLFKSKQMLELEEKGVFSFCKCSCVTDGIGKEAVQGEMTASGVEDGGRIQILIDYENVGTAGLTGAEYLCKDDVVTIFYSQASPNIERQYIEAMETKCGGLDIVKLRTIGKNGLDFYIAVRVGQIAAGMPDSKVLIITRDSGYQAIKDYCQGYTSLRNRIEIRDSIEAGIVAVDGNSERRRTILKNRERLSIENEFSAFEARKKLEKDIFAACRGTEFEEAASKILEIIDQTSTPKERYLSSLHLFGRSNGAKVYRLIRNAV